MTEKFLQQKVLQFCKKVGILAVKVDSTSSRGWPDLTVIMPNGVVLFVELKTETGRLSELQKATHRKIADHHANVYTIRSVEAFEQLTREYT